jgi:hypothetical protein
MFKLLTFAFLFLAAGHVEARAAERHVVLIVIDGLPAYLFDDPQASLPVIRGLVREGVAAEGGMRDPSPEVQKWAMDYLGGVAFRDFSEDFQAYKDWYQANRNKPVSKVIAESARRVKTDAESR